MLGADICTVGEGHRDEDVRYGWGYGGQMLYIVPRLGLTVVMTSDESTSAARTGHREDLHKLLGRIIDSTAQWSLSSE